MFHVPLNNTVVLLFVIWSEYERPLNHYSLDSVKGSVSLNKERPPGSVEFSESFPLLVPSLHSSGQRGRRDRFPEVPSSTPQNVTSVGPSPDLLSRTLRGHGSRPDGQRSLVLSTPSNGSRRVRHTLHLRLSCSRRHVVLAPWVLI